MAGASLPPASAALPTSDLQAWHAVPVGHGTCAGQAKQEVRASAVGQICHSCLPAIPNVAKVDCFG